MQRPISQTRLGKFLLCPMMYWFYYHSGLPKKTDFPRVMGTAVHRFIAKMHDRHSSDRPFFYKSKQSALGAWFGFYWKRVLEEFAGQLGDYPPQKAENYGKIGWFCINNYWERMESGSFGRVVEVETTYKHTLSPGIRLKGVVDQVRESNLEYIESIRPELIVNGRLRKDYQPYFLLDFKTGRFDFDPRRAGENNPDEKAKQVLSEALAREFALDQYPLLEFLEEILSQRGLYLRDYSPVDLPDLSDRKVQLEILKMQAPFHLDIQETLYTFLFEQRWRKKPAGFLLYNLYSDTIIPTYREETDYQELFEQIRFYTVNVQARAFPKMPGTKCQRCDYVYHCLGEKRFFISVPVGLPTSDSLLSVEVTLPERKPDKQLRMKLQIPRESGTEPAPLENEQLSFESIEVLGSEED